MRGKHAVKAVRRDMESTAQTIATLSTALAEAKARARRYEKDATRLPSVELEVARLRKQVAAGTSDALEVERRRSSEREANADELLTEVLGVIADAVAYNKSDEGESLLRFTPDHYAILARAGGRSLAWLHPSLAATRTHRRNVAHPRLSAFMQDIQKLKPGQFDALIQGGSPP